MNFYLNKMDFWKDKKVLITGGAGFLGSFVVEKLIKRGVNFKNIRIPRSTDTDLRIWGNCVKVVEGIDIVIHLAAKVGGIGFNKENSATLFYDNIIMGVQLMEAARRANIKKFVALATICAYPKYTPVPFKEENLWNGYPEETNAPYGLAKKMLLVQAQAYQKQYGFNAICLFPVNLYGPRDNFDSSSSHVIPALIRKVFEAMHEPDKLNEREEQHKPITVWGTGKPTREFLYVEDCAEGILLATEHYNKPEPVNLGVGFEISIKDLIDLIVKLTGFKGEIVWDHTKPDGQPRRMLDTTRALKEFDYRAKTDLESGLKKTIEWYSTKHTKSIKEQKIG